MAVASTLELRVRADETSSGDLGTARKLHTWTGLGGLPTKYASGTGSSQQDIVYSDTLDLAGSAQTIDLDTSLTDTFGATLDFVEVTGIFVYNKSTTTAETLTVGAGSNPLITWLNATGDAVVVGPGGVFCITSPIDGYAVTSGTGDTLTFDPGANTFSVDVLILGRSA